MIGLEFIIVLLSIWLGAYIGGVGIGFAGGLGVLLLTLFCGIKPGVIPFDVIEIIIAVIAAIVAMQVAGGMDYMVKLAERLLRKHPRHITFLAPLVTYVMTLIAGTGHTAFSTLPVIAEVAKEQFIRPSRPLSISVVASQLAITASPISAAVVFFSSIMEPYGISYLTIISISLPSTLIAVFCAALITSFLGKELKDDEIYQIRLAKGAIKLRDKEKYKIKSSSKLSLFLFLLGILSTMLYATAISENVGLIVNPVLGRNDAIIVFMLSTATLICLTCKVDIDEIPNASTFKSGMSACICIMGVAWLGDTFVKAHINIIQNIAGNMLQVHPYTLSLVLFLSSTLLYSQASTLKTIMPAALTLGVSPLTALASLPAVSGLFVLPTYPTLLAAIEIDDTGSTRIGKYVFNHSFMIPGVLAIFFSVLFSSLCCRFFLN